MKAWLEGKEAFLSGKPLSDNPYQHNSHDYFGYVDGWRAAKRGLK